MTLTQLYETLELCIGASFNHLDSLQSHLYERIMADVASPQSSMDEDGCSKNEVQLLRQSLLQKHEEEAFKKAAIGNRLNETIEKSIRGDVILWIDETTANQTEQLFFNKMNDLIHYLNTTCFFGILHKEF